MKTKIDAHGRIYFPRKWIENGFPKCGDYVTFYVDPAEGKIILKKAFPSCLSCKGEDNRFRARVNLRFVGVAELQIVVHRNAVEPFARAT